MYICVYILYYVYDTGYLEDLATEEILQKYTSKEITNSVLAFSQLKAYAEQFINKDVGFGEQYIHVESLFLLFL